MPGAGCALQDHRCCTRVRRSAQNERTFRPQSRAIAITLYPAPHSRLYPAGDAQDRFLLPPPRLSELREDPGGLAAHRHRSDPGTELEERPAHRGRRTRPLVLRRCGSDRAWEGSAGSSSTRRSTRRLARADRELPCTDGAARIDALGRFLGAGPSRGARLRNAPARTQGRGGR